MAGIHEAAEQEKLILSQLSSSMNSAPKKVVPKKHRLAQGHYTREFLLSNHQRMLANRKLVNILPGTTSHDSVSSSKVTIFGKQDLKKYENSYTPIKVRDLVPGVVNREKIVYAKTIVECANMASLHTVIQDETVGGGACKLCIYNLTRENAEQFVEGTKLAILNPYYKLATDGTHLMRVDNPMEVIIIQASDALEASAPSLLPIQHKDRGNKLFQEGKLAEALEEYSQAIMGDRHDPIFYSNRSLCHTRMRQFEAALSDATAAAAINPDDPKFKYRASMAWSGLGNHRRAIGLLEEIILASRDNTSTVEFQDKLTIEKIYLDQQGGKFDLKKVEELVLAGLPVQMADFIGPFALKKSGMAGCAERGLFATRDIRQGSVIHVSKAAVFLNDYKPDISNVIEISSNSVSPPFQILVSKLIQEMNKSRLFAQRVMDIVEDKTAKKSHFYTNFELYNDNGYDLVKDLPSPEFSIENIRYIATKKGFSTVLKGKTNSCDVSDRDYNLTSGAMKYGLWLIPSLLNHSCVGNVVRVVKGEVCLLKVFKDVKAGEELLFSAFDGSYFMTLNERKKSLKTLHGYVCHCALCKYETEPNITPLLAQTDKFYHVVKDFWRKYACNSNTRLPYPAPIDKYREYFSKGIELAEALGLGPQTFCGPLWSAFINLTCVINVDTKVELFFHEKIQKYLSELEVYHQHCYWTNYAQICFESFGPTHPKYIGAAENLVRFEKLFCWEL